MVCRGRLLNLVLKPSVAPERRRAHIRKCRNALTWNHKSTYFFRFFLLLLFTYLLGDGVQGKVLGPSLYSSPHLSEWLAMRPLVLCDDDVMTFTASGEGFTHLLVDRGETFESKGGLDEVCDTAG